MIKITKRQLNIMDSLIIGRNTVQEIVIELEKINGESLSDMTIQRDLNSLISLDYVKVDGKARSIRYYPTEIYKLLGEYSAEYLENYFDNEQRSKIAYDFSRLATISSTKLFTEMELEELGKLTNRFRNNKEGSSPTIFSKEVERITIEISWKSSLIEGNTYSLIETESLLKDNIKAEGKSDFEVQMLLNHKKILDLIYENKTFFYEVTKSTIEDVHKIIIEKLGVTPNIRNSLVRITGSQYIPLDNSHQISEELDNMCKVINTKNNIYEKALIAFAYLCYLQPFEDGNKRTSRMITNAILLSNDTFPISLRATPVNEYKRAILEYYELGSMYNLKRIFMDQARWSVDNYF